MSEALTLMQRVPYLRDRIRRYLTDNNTMPQQTHLSVTPSKSEMQIMFATNWLCAGSVSYAPAGGPGLDGAAQDAAVVHTATSTYTAGLFGWNGTIHTAVMTGLTPGTTYTYTACCDGSSCGNATTFKQPGVPSADSSLYVAVTADMGACTSSGGEEAKVRETVTTYVGVSHAHYFLATCAPNHPHIVLVHSALRAGTVQLFGYLVADRMIAEHRHGLGPTGQPFDLVLLAGDISYATTDPPKNEIEAFWDLWGVQAAGWAETAPAMYTVGNHEVCTSPAFVCVGVEIQLGGVVTTS